MKLVEIMIIAIIIEVIAIIAIPIMTGNPRNANYKAPAKFVEGDMVVSTIMDNSITGRIIDVTQKYSNIAGSNPKNVYDIRLPDMSVVRNVNEFELEKVMTDQDYY